jgi:hypothetical protein
MSEKLWNLEFERGISEESFELWMRLLGFSLFLSFFKWKVAVTRRL